MERAGADSRLEYWLSFDLPESRRPRPIRFLSSRRLAAGDVLNLPVRPTGELYPGETYGWQVTEVRPPAAPSAATLILVPFQP